MMNPLLKKVDRGFNSQTDSCSGDVTHLITKNRDSMGRRASKKVTTDGSITQHRRFIYRGYLQIACCDLTRSGHTCLWLLTWDPTQPVATRPLAIRKDGTWFAYGWDLTKNICEVFGPAGYIRTAYTYTPYGEVSESGDVTQPIQWSSEYHDTELALVYYNYRHYNPVDGRWIRRDDIGEQVGNKNYGYVVNKPIDLLDNLGHDYTVNVDSKNCTITFSLVIVLAFDPSVPSKDRPSIQRQIESTIEGEWSGQKKGCCTINIDVELREPSIWNRIEDWFTPRGRENNYVNVTYNQTDGYRGTNRSYVERGQTGVFVANPSEVNGNHNPRTDYATWSYAHEAGHLMGLEDGYYEANGRQGVRAGYNGDEMMTAAHARVTQGDIDRLTSKTECKCTKGNKKE